MFYATNIGEGLGSVELPESVPLYSPISEPLAVPVERPQPADPELVPV